jgi:shikimate kinase
VTAACRQLILTGLPGSGKTTVGRALAARIGWDFVDLDAAVAERAGRSVERIFAESGEERFREIEALATAELRGRDRLVTAPGGGWITRPAAVALLRPPARMAYLRVDPAIAAARIEASGEVRPLLQGSDPATRIHELHRERDHLYSTADLAVDTEVIVGEVVTQLEKWLVSEGLVP